jgi:hypothetical protein
MRTNKERLRGNIKAKIRRLKARSEREKSESYFSAAEQSLANQKVSKTPVKSIASRTC